MKAITLKRLFRRSDVLLSNCARPICKKTRILRRLCAASAGVLAFVGVLGFTTASRPVLTFAKYSYIEAKGFAQCTGVAIVGKESDKIQTQSDAASLRVPLDNASSFYESHLEVFADVSSQLTSNGCSTSVEGSTTGHADCQVTPITDSKHGLIEVDFEAFHPCTPSVGCTNSSTEMQYGFQDDPNMMQINVPFILPKNPDLIKYLVKIDYEHMAYMQVTLDMAAYLREFSWRIINAKGVVVASIPANHLNGTASQTVYVNLKPGKYKLETHMRWWFHTQFRGGVSFMYNYGGWGNPFASAKFEFIPFLSSDTSSGGGGPGGGPGGGTGGGIGGGIGGGS